MVPRTRRTPRRKRERQWVTYWTWPWDRRPSPTISQRLDGLARLADRYERGMRWLYHPGGPSGERRNPRKLRKVVDAP